MYGLGFIGDRGASAPMTVGVAGVAMPGAAGGVMRSGMDLFQLMRSTSPSDSDTSGVSSGSEFSEAALLDLMVRKTKLFAHSAPTWNFRCLYVMRDYIGDITI